jgi:hypothetical protein
MIIKWQREVKEGNMSGTGRIINSSGSLPDHERAWGGGDAGWDRWWLEPEARSWWCMDGFFRLDAGRRLAGWALGSIEG